MVYAASVDSQGIVLSTVLRVSRTIHHVVLLTVKKGQRNHPSRNRKARPPASQLVQVNHVKTEEARQDTNIVMGTLLVNSIPASVLFDSGASHSFMSESFARSHDIPFEKMCTPLVIQSPGANWQTTKISHGNHIVIGGLMFPVSLIALKASNIDIILGMDWLKPHKALIDCATETVHITHPSGQTVRYSARTV